MPRHISRKELKKDEIRETLAHGAEAVISHQKLAGVLIGTAVVLALAVLGWGLYTERQSAKASGALDEAMKVYEARIRTAGEVSDAGEVSYLEEKNKYEDAAKKLMEVANKYSRTRPGQAARYYAALSQEHLGRYDEAQKNLTQLENSNEEFAALARFQLADVYDKTGKSEESLKLYRQLADHPTVMVPKPVVLFTLADHLSKKNPQEAVKLYNQIKKDFADSSLAEQANQRLESLEPKT